jgi:flagellar hook-basal body complex protein FliE
MSSLEKYKFDKKEPKFDNKDFDFVQNLTGSIKEILNKQFNSKNEISALIVELSEFC